MNNQGWGLKDALFFIIVMCISILVTMVLYNKTVASLFGAKTENLSYSDIEEELIHAAVNYTNNFYYKPLDNGDNDYVTVAILAKNNIIDTINDPNNKNVECTGYVHFYRNNDRTQYDPYLKCGNNYQTAGYRSSYDA